LEALIEMIQDQGGPVVIYTPKAIDNLPDFDYRLSGGKVSVIWIDRFRTLKTKKEVFDAFDVAMRWYWDCRLEWSILEDMLLDWGFLPPNGCLLYFTSLKHLKDNDEDSYTHLIECLTRPALHWREKNYFMKALLVI
jgi:hypothetical protein